MAAEFCGQLTQVSGPHVPGPGGPRHHERQVFGPHPLRQQGHRGVPEDQRRRHPVGQHRACWPRPRRGPYAAARSSSPPTAAPNTGPASTFCGRTRAGHPARRSPPPPSPARPGRSGPRPSRAGLPGPRWSRSAATAGGSHQGAAGPGPPPPTPPATPRRPPRPRWRPAGPGDRPAPPRPRRRWPRPRVTCRRRSPACPGWPDSTITTYRLRYFSEPATVCAVQRATAAPRKQKSGTRTDDWVTSAAPLVTFGSLCAMFLNAARRLMFGLTS